MLKEITKGLLLLSFFLKKKSTEMIKINKNGLKFDMKKKFSMQHNLVNDPNRNYSAISTKMNQIEIDNY